jgi:hypothetical protein
MEQDNSLIDVVTERIRIIFSETGLMRMFGTALLPVL